MVALALLPCLGGGAAAATERSAAMAVSVEVVDPCQASTGPAGLAGAACASGGTPVAVVSRARNFAPTVAGGLPVAIDGAADADGLVTVYY